MGVERQAQIAKRTIFPCNGFDNLLVKIAARFFTVERQPVAHFDGKKAGGYFNQQIVEPIAGKNGPLGYLRLTLDTHTLATEAQQVDNTTNILRLMLLLSLAIGVVLTRTLLQGKRTRWQQSPFLLTASKPVPEEEESEKKE